MSKFSALKTQKRTPDKKASGPTRGKSSDGDFKQVSAYVRKDTHKAVSIALKEDDDKQDFSDLVQSLLESWLKSRG